MAVLGNQILIVMRLDTGFVHVVLLVVVFFILFIFVHTAGLLKIMVGMLGLRVLIAVQFASGERDALKMRRAFLRICHLTQLIELACSHAEMVFSKTNFTFQLVVHQHARLQLGKGLLLRCQGVVTDR